MEDHLEELRRFMTVNTIDRAGYAAIVAGCLVDRGASPDIAVDQVLEKLAEALPDASRFEAACREKAGEEEPTPGIQQAVAEEIPDCAPAWNAFHWLPMSAIAMLSRSPEARRTARENPDLLATAEKGFPDHFLTKLLKVLDDEELLVIHPGVKKGYRLLMGGISDNFQLHTLLAEVLIGWGELQGKRPPPDVAATAWGDGPQESSKMAEGVWNMFAWKAARHLPLPKDPRQIPPELIIWGEGTPSDIPTFEGARVVLLGPPSYSRAWSASRIFSGLQASLTITETLSPTAVQERLQRMAREAPGN